MIRQTVLTTLLFVYYCSVHAQTIKEVDVFVYGATSGGVISAYTAKKIK